MMKQQNITKVAGQAPRYAEGSAGLDTRFFAHRGIPAVTFGPKTERIHSFDEWVSIESTLKTAETISAALFD